jgi:hypothetical protein
MKRMTARVVRRMRGCVMCTAVGVKRVHDLYLQGGSGKPWVNHGQCASRVRYQKKKVIQWISVCNSTLLNVFVVVLLAKSSWLRVVRSCTYFLGGSLDTAEWHVPVTSVC